MINRAVKKMSDKKAELDQVKLIIFHRIFLILPITSIQRLVTKKNNQHIHWVFFLEKSKVVFDLWNSNVTEERNFYSRIAGPLGRKRNSRRKSFVKSFDIIWLYHCRMG